MGKKRTFCITGMGRSGTKFLAGTLALSPTWHVRHEPENGRGNVAKDKAKQIARWKGKDHYGEVNSYMRWRLMDLPVDTRAVVMREPYDLVKTCFNRKQGALSNVIRFELVEAFELMQNYMGHGVRCFKFEDFTNNPATIMEIAEHVGITDLKLPENHCKQPVNATPARLKIVKTFDELPAEIKDWATKTLGWYRREHYPELS